MIPNTSSSQGAQSIGSTDERLDIHGPRPSVTRISRKAILLAGVFGAALGLVVLMLGFGDHSAPRKEGAPEENTIRPSGPIEPVKDLPRDYSFDVSRLTTPYGGSIRPSTPAPPAARPPSPSAQDQAVVQALRDQAEQRRKALEQQQKDQQAALDSPLLFSSAKSSTSAATTASTTMPTVVLQDSRHLNGSESASQDDLGLATGANPTHQQEKEAFLTQDGAIGPYLSKPLLDPISKYELKAGSVIAGALLTAINTDLPGEVIGQVTENVYDSATGNYLLIPQGAKLLGKYQSLVTNGQNRALLVWQRLLFPDGKSISLEGMPGTDESGAAGLTDTVDYHLDKLAAATVLSTALAYAGNLARNPNASSGNNGQDVIGDAVAQQANRTGEKIIDRELDVQPTITVRQGWPLRVLVNKDMVLAPYSAAAN